MKKFGIIVILLLMVTTFTTAQAEIREGAFSLTPYYGITVFERNQDIHKNSNWGTYGLRGGYHFTKNISLEGYLNYTQVELETPLWYNYPWQDIYRYGIEGLYHFMPDGRIVPYIALGFGGIHYTEGLHYYNDPETYEKYKSDRLSVDYGGGVKFFLTNNIALQVDLRHSLSLNSRQDNPHHVHNDLLTSLGINFNFGGVQKAEAPPKSEEPPPPMAVDDAGDSDKDGVPNNQDECPRTPAGMAVDKHGCMPDSDNDGILDYEDNCPGTPEGAKVDRDGCPPDSDFDGVSDYKDKCPHTPEGTMVGPDGCKGEKLSMVLKVEFDAGKAVIKKQYHKEIKKVADFMKKNPKANATIVGHTDNLGKRGDNIALSKARANSIRKYLVDKFDIDPSRIKALGYGPDKPIASNKTSEGRQKNRRVVASFEVVQKK